MVEKHAGGGRLEGMTTLRARGLDMLEWIKISGEGAREQAKMSGDSQLPAQTISWMLVGKRRVRKSVAGGRPLYIADTARLI